jgi:hypothetical protein
LGGFSHDSFPAANSPRANEAVMHVGVSFYEFLDRCLAIALKEEDSHIERIFECSTEFKEASVIEF